MFNFSLNKWDILGECGVQNASAHSLQFVSVLSQFECK